MDDAEINELLVAESLFFDKGQSNSSLFRLCLQSFTKDQTCLVIKSTSLEWGRSWLTQFWLQGGKCFTMNVNVFLVNNFSGDKTNKTSRRAI